MRQSIDKEIKNAVQVEQSYQLWYNKYLYKSTFIIPGIFVLRNYHNEAEIEAHIEDIQRASWKRALFSSFIDAYRQNQNAILAFAKLTDHGRKNKDIFVRIQDPHVSIFTNNLNIHTALEKAFAPQLHSISRPNEKCIPALLDGKNVMVVKKLPHDRYRYKVVINNYSVSHSIPKSLLDWGLAQGDAVRFSKKTERYFRSPGLYLDQGFLYVEDESTLTMCNMFLTKCPKRIIKYVLESEL